MQDGLSDLSAIEEQALVLSQAAIELDQARSGKRDPFVLTTALEANVEVWVAIRALVDDPATTLQPNIRENLRRLSVFVASSTFMHGANIPDSTLNTLININFQISEGLLEGANRRN
ncbi:MAG: flagellar biosynthesis regulator FlaF [Pseudomonadota bacterium]